MFAGRDAQMVINLYPLNFDFYGFWGVTGADFIATICAPDANQGILTGLHCE